MIDLVTVYETARCRHCGRPIELGRASMEREARWYHDVNGLLTCRSVPVAEPVESSRKPFTS